MVDLGGEGAPAHAVRRRAQALALRDACLGWLPCGGLLARLADPFARGWLRRSGSPLLGEIDAIARTLGRPGIWLLHGAYAFGCTALADEGPEGPVLRRTLDWPFPGLGRLVEVARQRGAAGDFLSVTWPGFAGLLTAVAPGRFAASINQAPMRRRTRVRWLLWLDYALNAIEAFCASGRPPPEHLLRVAFETCANFDEARRFLEAAPVARPVLFLVTGCAPGERVLIEREIGALRTYRDDTVVANAWRDRSDGWRPRVCGEGRPMENNRRRMAAMSAWTGRHPPTPGLGNAARRECLHARHRRNVRRHRPTARLRMGSARRQRDAGDRRDGGRGTFRRCQARFFAAAPRGRWRARYWPV